MGTREHAYGFGMNLCTVMLPLHKKVLKERLVAVLALSFLSKAFDVSQPVYIKSITDRKSNYVGSEICFGILLLEVHYHFALVFVEFG